MIKYIIIIFLCLCNFNTLKAITSGYAFLNYGTASRMIGNRTGVVDSYSSEATVYNPALLSMSKPEILLSYYRPFSRDIFDKDSEALNDINIYDIGIAFPGKKSGYGLNFLLLQNGSFAGYDEYGNSTGSFDTMELATTFGYGWKVKYFDIGMNSKIVYQGLYSDYNKMVFSLGLGLTRNIVKNLMAGLYIDNIYSEQFVSNNMGYEKLPLQLLSGLNYQIGILNCSLGIGTDFRSMFFTVRSVLAILHSINFISEYGNSYFQYTNNNQSVSELRNLVNAGVEVKWKKVMAQYLLIFRGDLGMDQSVGLKINY